MDNIELDELNITEELAFDELAEFEIGEDEVPVNETMEVKEDEPDNLLPGTSMVDSDDNAEDTAVKETDWANDGDHSKFIDYAKDKIKKVPQHSGNTVPGCERAKAYFESFLNEMSKAMRSDLNGTIDEAEVDALRGQVEDFIDRLDKRINKLRPSRKKAASIKLASSEYCEACNSQVPMWHDIENSKLVCMSCNNNGDLEKTAETPVLNVYMSPFEKAIVSTLINSTVSSGNNIEVGYNLLKQKYDFTPREELAIQQLVSDYGYFLNIDRGRIGETVDPSSGDGLDFQTNYHA